MKVFREAGELLEKKWRAAGYDEKLFPDLAAEVLSESNIPEKIMVWELVEWALSQTELPQQKDLHGSFGDPPITLFNAPRFHLDVYFWLQGTTAVHQHSFCGAFQVFHGSSIHSQYEFETERDLNYFARVGKTRLRSCEIFEVGDVQRILPGEQYIHSLFHLDQPSATIVARTSYSDLNKPQYSYFKPGFAADPFFETPVGVKKIQLFSAAIRADHPDADKYIESYLRDNDFHSSFQVLSSLRPLLRKTTFKEVFGIETPGDRFDRFVGILEETHPDLGELPRRLFTETLRLEEVVALRNVISEPEHRFFLALLLNADELEQVMSLINDRFPNDEPRDKFLDWVSELGNTRVIGDAYPNGLGIPGFSDFDTAVLEELLANKEEKEIAGALMGTAEVDEPAIEKVSQSIERLKQSSVFGRLLQK